MGDRFYNDTTGRFTSTDPETGSNVNTYTYPLDPINSNDLDGHKIAPEYWKWSGRGLGELERAQCRKNYVKCLSYASISHWADAEADRHYPNHSKSYVNNWWQAFRHQIWQATLYLAFGYPGAVVWGRAHEGKGGGRSQDSKRDLGNNAIGRDIGRAFKRTGLHPRAQSAWVMRRALQNIADGKFHICIRNPRDKCNK